MKNGRQGYTAVTQTTITAPFQIAERMPGGKCNGQFLSFRKTFESERFYFIKPQTEWVASYNTSGTPIGKIALSSVWSFITIRRKIYKKPENKLFEIAIDKFTYLVFNLLR